MSGKTNVKPTPSGRTTYRGPAGTGSRATGQANAPGFASGLGALADMLSGAGIGATAATLGVGGDLEKLARGLYGAATARPEQDRLAAGLMAAERSTLPSTEDVRSWLPNPTQFSMPVDQNPYSQLGEFMPLPVSPGAAARGAATAARDTASGARSALGALGRVGAAGVEMGAQGRGPLSFMKAALEPSYAVRPRGGNFNTERLHAYLGHALDVQTPEFLERNWVPENARARTGPAAEWAQKQLANYLKRDLGAPTDPLLQVEKELPGLHFADAEDAFARMTNVRDLRLGRAETYEGMPDLWDPQPDRPWPINDDYSAAGKAQRAHNELTGGAPLTPWGAYSDEALSSLTPREYAEELAGGAMYGESPFDELSKDRYGWIEKLPEDTKIWGLSRTDHDDQLGFGHVLDYFEAALDPYKKITNNYGEFRPEILRDIISGADEMHPYHPRLDVQRWKEMQDAGLLLTPEQIAKTSVADAVRKTAKWNEVLASGMGGPQNPDLLKGWKNVMKEYPDEGMKWVELGPKDVEPVTELPEGYAVMQHGSLKDAEGAPLFGVRGPNGFEYLRRSPDEAKNDWLRQHNLDMRKEELSAALRAEGDTMGICVGSNPEYCERALAGTGRIFSLRDKKGTPHVTVETRPGKSLLDTYANGDPDEFNALVEPAMEDLQNRAPELADEWDMLMQEGYSIPQQMQWLQRNAPDIYESFASKSQPVEDIIQIKGKQNAAPMEKYLPYVQDFVKSGKWGRVGDLHNTGLRKLDAADIYDLSYDGGPANWRPPATGYYSQQDLRNLLQENAGLQPERATRFMQMMGWMPEDDGLTRLEVQPRPDDYAAGGSVQPSSTFLQRAQAMLAQGYAGGGAVQRLSKLWHAGTIKPGDELTRPLFTAESPELAATYLDMAADRGMTGAQLLPYSFDLRRAAPEREVATFAKQAGIDFEDGTPASAFDQEIHGAEPVGRLLRLLRQRGYDHTVLDDIGYGAQIEGKAHVIFPEPGRRANRAAP